MDGWTFADIWERVAERVPEADALIQGGRRVSWADFDRRADGIARTLLDLGVDRQDKVAMYLYNCPEYLEAMFACFKISLVPVNTNYRYGEDELIYLWDNSDSVAVVFHGCFTETIEPIRNKVEVKLWLWVDDGTGPCPDWATPYEVAANASDIRVAAPWGRGGDDLNFIYTGGTTGMPKGVMWRQDDLVRALVGTTSREVRDGEPDLTLIDAAVNGPGIKQIPACPLMHGTGQFTSLLILSSGGAIVCLEGRKLDFSELLDSIEREKVAAIAIVGDSFAKPIIKELEANPDRWDLSSLAMITSSGVMWSEDVKATLAGYLPTTLMIDVFSSSEALGMGQSISSASGASRTAKFVLGENARVVTEDGRDVEPGSGESGRVAVKGFQPVGYYKDEEKSKATFIEIEGSTYSIPGDWAMVEADGSLTLLGRGSVCINTGGEKVFPEEVEEALKIHPTVHDAVVVGLPDDKWGQSITGVVELWGDSTLDEDAVIAHVKDHLAAFKAPKRVVTIDSIGRAPNGKVDYKRLTAYAAEQLGVKV